MTSFWQGALGNALAAAVLAGAAAFVARHGRRPTLARALWLLVLLKLVTPPLFSLPVFPASPASPAPPAASEEGGAGIAASFAVPIPGPGAVQGEIQVEPPPPAPPGPGASALVSAPTSGSASGPSGGDLAGGLWLAGALLVIGLAMSRAYRFGRAAGRADLAPGWIRAECERLFHAFGLRRAPEVRLFDGRVPPLGWGVFGRRRVLLPAELLDRFSESELRTVLAHELAHLARRDPLLRWIELVAVGAWWWFPVAWWARRGLREAGERCCDAHVVGVLPGEARSYARALLTTLDFLAGAPAAAPATASGLGGAGKMEGRTGRMERRIRMIIDETTRPFRLSSPARLLVVLLALVILPLAAGTAGEDEPFKKGGLPAEKSEPPPAGAPEEGIDERLERLERMTEAITEEIKALRAEREKKPDRTWDLTLGPEYRWGGYFGKFPPAGYTFGHDGNRFSFVARDGRTYKIRVDIGEVECRETRSKKILWKTKLGTRVHPRVEPRDGRVRITSRQGRIFLLDPETGKVVESLQTPLSEWVKYWKYAKAVTGLQILRPEDRIRYLEASLEMTKATLEKALAGIREQRDDLTRREADLRAKYAAERERLEEEIRKLRPGEDDEDGERR